MREFAMRILRLPVGACAILMALLCAMPTSVVAQAAGAPRQKYPDVVTVEVRSSGAERFDFDVTVSSPYDTPKRYADAFRVSAKGGTVFGERRLLHDHADEQPFTRDLHGVMVPRGVRVVRDPGARQCVRLWRQDRRSGASRAELTSRTGRSDVLALSLSARLDVGTWLLGALMEFQTCRLERGRPQLIDRRG